MNNRAVSGWKHENSKWMSFLGPIKVSGYTLHRPPALASRIQIHWGAKMGANQSTRNEPTPGEEGESLTFSVERAFIVNYGAKNRRHNG